MQKKFKNIEGIEGNPFILSSEILEIAKEIQKQGGTAYLVGGCVRDEIIHRLYPALASPSKDIDIEVFKLSQYQLEIILKKFGTISNVGQSFAVTKLETATQSYDFNLPRREIKVGFKHTDYKTEVDIKMSILEAAERRDLTMNAIYYNPLTEELIDPFNGLADIQDKIIRATSAKFSEDALRVLRVMQFVARFNFTVNVWTLEMCQKLVSEFDHLSKERIGEEFHKMATRNTMGGISNALYFLRDSKWITKFPQLDKLELQNQFYLLHELTEEVVQNAKELQRSSEEVSTLFYAAIGLYLDNPSDFFKQINLNNKISKEALNLIDVALTMKSMDFWDIGTSCVLFCIRHTLVKLNSLSSRVLLNILLNSCMSLENHNKFAYYDRFVSDTDLLPRVTGNDLLERGYVKGKTLGLELQRIFQLQLESNFDRASLLNMVTNID